MGNSSSAPEKRMAKFYGGSECFGGVEDLGKYETSVMSSKKRGLIKDIAEVLGDKLKIDGLKNAKSQDIDTTVRLLRECVPDPRRGGNGKRFSSDKSKQEEACRVLAGAINERMGNIISLKLPASELCQQVSEVMYSLFIGLSGELTAARDDIKRIIGNLTALKELTNRQYRALQNKMSEEGTGILPAELTVLGKIHEDVLQEFDRQLNLLQNMLDAIVPHTETELMELLKESEDLKRLVKRVRKYPGTVEFGRKISYLMGGFKTAAEAALVVDNALKRLGLSYTEYAKVHDHRDLTKLLSSKTIEALNKKDTDLARYEAAKLSLYKHQYMHDDIVKLLGKKDGKGESSDEDNVYLGSAEITGGLKIDKRITKRKNLKKALIEDFNRQVSALFSEILTSAKLIAQSFGGAKSISDNTLKFVKALEAMPNISKKYTYFSVSGIIDDVRSRQERSEYQGASKHVIEAADVLIKEGGPAVPYLKDMRNAMSKVSEIIDAFSRKFSEGFGPLESWESYKNTKAVEGSAEIMGGDISTEIAKIGYTMQEAIDTIVYYCRISLMRYNMGKSAKELTAYQAGYNKVLGDAIADAIDGVKQEIKNWEELTKRDTTAPTDSKDLSLYARYVYLPYVANPNYDYSRVYQSAAGAGLNNAKWIEVKNMVEGKARNGSVMAEDVKLGIQTRISSWDTIRQFGIDRLNAKINMYRTAEALDIYLKEFTNGIASHPDDIQDIIKMLNNTEINARWYNDTSGNIIVNIFESFPKVDADSNRTYSGYKTGALPAGHGNPFLGNVIVNLGEKNANSATYAIREALKPENYGALKNIISVFIGIGDKFGGRELIKQTHMPSKLMVKYIQEYIAYSAFHVGLKGRYIIGNDGSVAGRRVGDAHDSPRILGMVGVASNNTNGKIDVILTPIRGTQFYEIIADNSDLFAETDKLFIYSMKAIVAKILTVIGMYRVLQVPIQRDGIGYDSKIRAVIGGFESKPKIIPEAMELYIRLPLLAEFYRNIFTLDTNSNNRIIESDLSISMIPEIDGIFSGLITLIFDKAKNVDNGTYSDTEISYLITEINKIYSKFSKSENPISDTINEFISEVNRRYGLLAESERAKYTEEISNRYNTDDYVEPSNQVDIALKGIDEDDTYRRPAPSDSYLSFGALAANNGTHKHKISDTHKKLVFLAREKMDDMLKVAEEKLRKDTMYRARQHDLKKISFGFLIKSKQEELSKSKNNDESFDIVRTAISSLGTFSSPALEKSYIMFHETVLTGLEALGKIYSKLDRFIKFMDHAASFIKSILNNGMDVSRYDGNPGSDKTVFSNRYLLKNTDDNISKFIVQSAANTSSRGLFIELNFELLFSDFCDTLCEHVAYCDKICNVQIQGNSPPITHPQINEFKYGERKISITIDNSKFREIIYGLFNSVKQHINKYRGILPNDIIKYYEKSENAGSVFWLEKNLINGYLENKSSTDLGLDLTSKNIQTIADFFVRRFSINTHKVIQPDNTFSDKAVVDSLMPYNFYDVFSSMIYCYNKEFANDLLQKQPFYRSNKSGKNNNDATFMRTNNLMKLFMNLTGKSHNAVKPDDPYLDVPESAPVAELFKELWEVQNTKEAVFQNNSLKIGYDTSRGVIHMFNKLLVSYLYTVYDDPSKSCYVTTLNKFVNSQFNSAIFDHKNYAFKIKSSHADNLGTVDWEVKMPICEHVAFTIKQIISLKALGDMNLMVAKSDLSEVPSYLRERMKANLPVYEKLFTMLMNRCKIIRDLLMILNVEGCYIYAQVPHPEQITNARGEPIWAKNTASLKIYRSENDVRRKFSAALDRVIAGCVSINQCIADTLHDLADLPKYLELNENFIQLYESANGIMPIMPISTLGAFFVCGRNQYMPVGKLGSDGFKLLYGTRQVMNSSNYKLSDMPWIQHFIRTYNNTMDQRYHIKEPDMTDFITYYIPTMKYLVNSTVYAKEFATNYLHGPNTVIFDISGNATVEYGNSGENNPFTQSVRYPESNIAGSVVKTYQSTESLNKIISITESSDQKKTSLGLIKHIIELDNQYSMSDNNRKDLITFNIIDLNVFPINMNALAREMPLIHLYNYAYSFNRNVINFYNIHYPFEKNSANDEAVVYPHTISGYYLMDPYNDKIDKKSYMDNNKLSTPYTHVGKYILDEIGNKALACDYEIPRRANTNLLSNDAAKKIMGSWENSLDSILFSRYSPNKTSVNATPDIKQFRTKYEIAKKNNYVLFTPVGRLNKIRLSALDDTLLQTIYLGHHTIYGLPVYPRFTKQSLVFDTSKKKAGYITKIVADISSGWAGSFVFAPYKADDWANLVGIYPVFLIFKTILESYDSIVRTGTYTKIRNYSSDMFKRIYGPLDNIIAKNNTAYTKSRTDVTNSTTALTNYMLTYNTDMTNLINDPGVKPLLDAIRSDSPSITDLDAITAAQTPSTAPSSNQYTYETNNGAAAATAHAACQNFINNNENQRLRLKNDLDTKTTTHTNLVSVNNMVAKELASWQSGAFKADVLGLSRIYDILADIPNIGTDYEIYNEMIRISSIDVVTCAGDLSAVLVEINTAANYYAEKVINASVLEQSKVGALPILEILYPISGTVAKSQVTADLKHLGDDYMNHKTHITNLSTTIKANHTKMIAYNVLSSGEQKIISEQFNLIGEYLYTLRNCSLSIYQTGLAAAYLNRTFGENVPPGTHIDPRKKATKLLNNYIDSIIVAYSTYLDLTKVVNLFNDMKNLITELLLIYSRPYADFSNCYGVMLSEKFGYVPDPTSIGGLKNSRDAYSARIPNIKTHIASIQGHGFGISTDWLNVMFPPEHFDEIFIYGSYGKYGKINSIPALDKPIPGTTVLASSSAGVSIAVSESRKKIKMLSEPITAESDTPWSQATVVPPQITKTPDPDGKPVPVFAATNKQVEFADTLSHRFSTKFMRNLLWISELHRYVRSELNKNLLAYNSKLVSGRSIVAPGITETKQYFDNYPITLENYEY